MNLTITDQGTVETQIYGEASWTPLSSGKFRQFDEGTTVSLQALPSPGFVFSGWTGNVKDTSAANTSIEMKSDQNISAVFKAKTVPADNLITVYFTGLGGGSVTLWDGTTHCIITTSGDQCGFADNSVLTLTANSGGSSTFDGWSGAVTGTGISDPRRCMQVCMRM